MGPNVLKVATCFTALLFLFLVISHDQHCKTDYAKLYIDRLTFGVVLDILDTGEILDVFYTEDQRVPVKDDAGVAKFEEFKLPQSLAAAILVFACINTIIPTLGIIEQERHVSVRKDSRSASESSTVCDEKTWKKYRFWYLVARVWLVNIPFFVLRVVLWVLHNRHVSVLIAKNLILIIMDGLTLWDEIHDPMERPVPVAIDGTDMEDFEEEPYRRGSTSREGLSNPVFASSPREKDTENWRDFQ